MSKQADVHNLVTPQMPKVCGHNKGGNSFYRFIEADVHLFYGTRAWGAPAGLGRYPYSWGTKSCNPWEFPHCIGPLKPWEHLLGSPLLQRCALGKLWIMSLRGEPWLSALAETHLGYPETHLCK